MGTHPSEQDILDTLRSVREANYGIVSLCTLIVYDILLTLCHEKTYIWRERWSLPKIAYLCTRYYAVVYFVTATAFLLSQDNSLKVRTYVGSLLTLSKPSHHPLVMARLIGGPIVFMTLSNIVLALRVYAIYDQNRHLLILLVILLAGQFIATLYVTVVIALTPAKSSFPVDVPFQSGCPIPRPGSARFQMVGWVPNFVFITTLFLLTLWNFIKSIKQAIRTDAAQDCRRRMYRHIPPLLRALVRDGTAHYITIVVAQIVTLFLAMSKQGSFRLLAGAWLVAMYSISTSRLILHLCVFAARQQGCTSTWHPKRTCGNMTSIMDDFDDFDEE
ncbi:hypothetical protein APHAL10511_000020 [Amanita phalloides]|nr:hypothetical protein APHAL10511_000020 [Amanita phalloides]